MKFQTLSATRNRTNIPLISDRHRAAFAAWLLMNLLLVVVPRYGAYAMTRLLKLLTLSATVYHCMLPKVPLMIRFESNKVLSFHFGWCFYLVIAAGLLCFLVGVSIAAVDLIYPHKFSTILEVDYDTPFDRHIIIEDSSTSKKRSKGLEDPPGLGKRLLRRLSSKKDEKEEASSSEPMRLHGLDNRAFDQEPPKSPWRYPFQRPAIQGTAFQRTESQDSTSSTSSIAKASVHFAEFPQHRPLRATHPSALHTR
ncbi:uncharacterized protein LOC103521399 [Diaphorina citri]|uniref:Uncharacterized protein LOC103521399 n=1 Tax=Diaphorina citri TaxID=121845 RepID=A0A1S3DMZ8_DIACI|nr:uncharacterized protein LOC103521399 [Diaphorina citri]